MEAAMSTSPDMGQAAYGPDPHVGLPWIDPAVAPCLHKLAPVSRTIRDLVAGAPVRLESRGTHELKGVPGSWEIFAVAG
jgi:hypothetical protein